MHVRSRAAAASLLVAVAGLVVVGCGRPDGSDERRVELAPATVDHVVLPSIVRVTPSMDLDRDDASAAIELAAASGEHEAAQVAILAPTGAPRVVVEPTKLVNGPGRIDVTAYLEHELVVERGSPAGRAGTYVDPLIPARGRAVELSSDRPTFAWIDYDVPRSATPGIYTGQVRIRRADADGVPIAGEDAILDTIDVAVTVHHAGIPDQPTLDSHIGFDQSQLVRFEDVQGGTVQLRELTDRYAQLLADARLSIGDVGALPPGALAGHRGLPGDGDYLLEVFDRRGMASVRIPLYLDYPFKDPLGRDRAAVVQYLRRSMAWARRNGLADRAYVFVFDEPDVSEAGDIRELHELIRQADPTLRQLVTRESTVRELQGSVDIWAPNINPTRFRQADVDREHRRGRETWWYPSITTWAPYPTLFIDELRPTPRALGWLAWQHDIDGFLYWSATHWHEVDDPYEDPATYNETDVDGNGDGVLVYPGAPVGLPGTPVPSVRLLQLRDGIEDHDLLTLADCNASPAERRRLRAAVRAAAPALDRITPTIEQVKALRSAAFSVLDPLTYPTRCSARRP